MLALASVSLHWAARLFQEWFPVDPEEGRFVPHHLGTIALEQLAAFPEESRVLVAAP
jgi:hypothetical protein